MECEPKKAPEILCVALDTLLNVPCHPQANFFVGWSSPVPGALPSKQIQLKYTNPKLKEPFYTYICPLSFSLRALCRMSVDIRPTGTIYCVHNWRNRTELYYLRTYDRKIKIHRCYYLGKQALRWTSVVSPDNWHSLIAPNGTFYLNEPMSPNAHLADIFENLSEETQLLVTTSDERKKLAFGKAWIKTMQTKNSLCYERYENIGRTAWLSDIGQIGILIEVLWENKLEKPFGYNYPKATETDVTWAAKLQYDFNYRFKLGDGTLYTTEKGAFDYTD